MKKQGNQIKIGSGNLIKSMTQEQADKYNDISAYMAAKGVKTANGSAYSPAEIFIYAFENFSASRGGRTATGTGDEVLGRIHDAVQAQMKLNKATDKLVTVGRGRNEVKIKYEQRSITERFMRESANANAVAVDDYLKVHGDAVIKHNEWLVKNCGYPVDADTQSAIDNFNRRTSKANIKADKDENGDIE